MKGIFITFEGLDGSGKTTQIKLLSKWMKNRGIKHILTKEPGTGHVKECEKIREIILDPSNELTPTTELLLFLADRAQHVHQLILPSLEKGVHVLCDRFSDSTRAIQAARGLSRTKIDKLLEFTTSDLDPDLTFVLDIPTEISLKRAMKKSKFKEGDRIERAGIRFHEIVRNNLLKISEGPWSYRYYVVDVAPPKTEKEIQEEIIKEVSKKLWGTNLGE